MSNDGLLVLSTAASMQLTQQTNKQTNVTDKRKTTIIKCIDVPRRPSFLLKENGT